MAYAPLPECHTKNVLGRFVEKDFGKTFEYSKNEHLVLAPPAHGGKNIEFTHKIWVGPLGEYRFARVGKTVAHVIVDENDFGYVVEKWIIKQHVEYNL